MDVDRFRTSPIGTVVPITVEQHGRQISHFAFRPSPLPDTVELQPETYATIERAAMELGLLEGTSERLDNPHWITRPLIRREAVSTSALEGTFSTLEDLFATDLEDSKPESRDAREVANYVAAAETGVSALSTRPVSLNLINELHAILLGGTPGAASAGRVREAQVAIGSPGSLISEATFVPPPPGPLLDDLFSDWEKWNYRSDSLPLLARIAVSHYQFETIHPYMDGNGRMGRLITILLLIDRGPLSNHYMVLSPYIESRRDRYVNLLSYTTASGDFDPWVRFFAEAVRIEASAARSRISALVQYRDDTVDQLRQAGLKGSIIEIAEQLVERPVITPSSTARAFGVRYQTANRAIARLVVEGVVEEATGRNYGRIFIAREVIRLLRLGPG